MTATPADDPSVPWLNNEEGADMSGLLLGCGTEAVTDNGKVRVL